MLLYKSLPTTTMLHVTYQSDGVQYIQEAKDYLLSSIGLPGPYNMPTAVKRTFAGVESGCGKFYSEV